jgi:hypothetical protein
VYKGDSGSIRDPTPGFTEYRVFREGGSGFVSIHSVREDAEKSASEFCERSGKAMNAVRETVATPPFVLGNFPRIEIIFQCIDAKATAPSSPVNDKYARIAELKRLLDSGALTQAEFDKEKAKVLGEP